MTETEYVGLLAELRDTLPRVEYLACPALHPTRQATALRAELGLIRPPSEAHGGLKSRVKRTLPWLVLLVYAVKRTVALAIVHLARWSWAPRLQPVTHVLRSWVVTRVDQALERDFYLGDLPGALASEGRSVVRLLRQAGRSSQLTHDLAVLRHGDPAVLPEDAFVPVLAPLGAVVRLLRAWLQLHFSELARDSGPRRVVVRAVLRDLGSVDTAVALEIHTASRRATEMLRPDVYLTFYEGYSWEPCAWLGIDAAGRGTTVVGFNHTVLCHANFAMRYPAASTWRRSVPDIVLCAGDAQRDLLQTIHAGCGTSVRTLGSPRVQGGILAASVDDAKRFDAIVLPEGILEECVLLFRLAAAAADLSADVTFMVRLHPVLPFEALPADVRKLIDRPNIMLNSDSDFAGALRQCRAVVYRGSSAVLQAMLEGLVPIQYSVAGADDVDPLFGADNAREICFSPEGLVTILRAIADQDPREAFARRQHRRIVSRRYAAPFQPATIRALATVAARHQVAEEVPT